MSTSKRPLPLRFAEKAPVVLSGGNYSQEAQKRVDCDAVPQSVTHVETGTGGHNDTDTDSDE